MSNYELVCLIPLKYTENEIPQILNRISETVKKNNARIIKQENLGKRKIAYPIKQNRHGYFIVTEISAKPKDLKKIQKELPLFPEILRCLFAKFKPEGPKSERRAIPRESTVTRPSELIELKPQILKKSLPKISPKKVLEKPKIALEDLDKKLDEILSDGTFNA